MHKSNRLLLLSGNSLIRTCVRLFHKYPLYKYFFALSDWLMVVMALLLAAIVQQGQVWVNTHVASGTALLTVFLVATGTVFVFQYFNLYKINIIFSMSNHLVRIALVILVSTLFLTVAAFFSASLTDSTDRFMVLTYAAIALTVIPPVRLIVLRNLLLLAGRYRIVRRRALLVGAGPSGKKLAVTLFLHGHIGLDVIGFIDDEIPAGTSIFRGTKVLGCVDDLPRVIASAGVKEVLICLDNSDHPALLSAIESCRKTDAVVKICSPLYEVIPSRLFIEHYGEMPVVAVAQSVASPIREAYKRVFDVVLAAIGLVCLAPFILGIIVLIKLDSAGPVLYRQTRIGRNGNPFTFFKFRSMSVGSDKDEHRKRMVAEMIRAGSALEIMEKGTTKIVDRSRITRVGKWLRKTSLDELPQLLNVLRGEMSLVGPRPCLPYELEQYEDWHKERLRVAPGCTGVWQVSGRSEVGFSDMVVLDLYYIQNASLFMDMKLILKTIPVMLFGKGGG